MALRQLQIFAFKNKLGGCGPLLGSLQQQLRGQKSDAIIKGEEKQMIIGNPEKNVVLTPEETAKTSYIMRHPVTGEPVVQSDNPVMLQNWVSKPDLEQLGDPTVGGDLILHPTSSGLHYTQHTLKNPTHHIMYDEYKHERFAPGTPSTRAFAYFVATTGRMVWATWWRFVVFRIVMTMAPARNVVALGSIEVDLTRVAEGSTVTVKWRGKPVFIRHRTQKEIDAAVETPIKELRHKEMDADRHINPKWAIVLGVCPHLGCVPLPGAGDFGGWFCPCHGSTFDTSGRIRRGPAPYNLEVPEYVFLTDDTIKIG
eukprot:TRINITY_DN7358_c0_g1_i1.p2 TRINITY_DN7358_c0_g1~~TRINITY_DN7358_c0_g1_i1.p2  ORF type:complete len:312 (-),score=40.70 TRINITY_DN7358_c0_g1_i1:167-1102(-)